MRRLLVLIAMLLAVTCGSKTPVSTEAELIAYTKAIDVSILDPTLPSQKLEEWLRMGLAQVDVVSWETGINSCGDKPDGEEPPDGFDLCATVLFRKNGVNGRIILKLGTSRKGIVGPPKLVYALMGSYPPAMEIVYKLSDIAPVLEKLQGTTRPTNGR